MSMVDVRTLTGITGDSRGAKSVILKPAPKHSEELPRLWPNSGEVSVVDDIKLALLGDNGSSCSYQGRLSGGDGDAGGDGMNRKDLISDVNVNEIYEHIETETLSEWVNAWQKAALSTLTPPNEPLTWNELGNMVEKPVYIVELEDGESCWVLVHTVDDIKALFVSAFDQYDYGNRELYGQTWLAYRRLPEVSP